MSGIENEAAGGGGAGGRVRRRHDWEAMEPSTALIEALADLQGVDPVALATDEGQALYHYIDPEALDRFVTNQPDGGAELTVQVDGYIARITGDELVVESRTVDDESRTP